MARKKIEYKKVSFNIPVKLLEKIKTYSEELGISYTTGFVFLLSSAFEQKESLKSLEGLLNTYNDLKKEQN